jgi:hypothetical protein
MDQRRQLLELLDSLKVLSRIENQALHKGDFSRVEQVQDEKELIREQIDELEPIPEGGVSRHTADEAVKRVVSQIMQLDRENNEKLLQQMGVLKAEAESQSQTRTTLRRVQGAYAKRLSSAHWEAYT